MLFVERASGPDAIDALEGEWDTLTNELSPFLPFRTALWNRLWWKHFARTGFFRHDEFLLHTVRDHDGRLVGVAPMMRTVTGIPWLPHLRVLHFLGRDPFMTELRGLVCHPRHHNAVFAAIHTELFHTGRRNFDWCHWAGLRPDSIESGVATVRWSKTIPDFYLRFENADWQQFKTALPRNIKESLRKCYNSLKRDGHTFTLRITSNPVEVPDAIDRFLTLHHSRAQLKHTNVFATPQSRAFLHEYATRMAERGQLRIFELEVAGEVAAVRLGFVSQGELYLYYTGYKQEWSRYSVMTTTTAEAIKWAIENGYGIVNLSAGRDVAKTRWRPHEILHHEGYELSGSRRGRVALQLRQFLSERRSNHELAEAQRSLDRPPSTAGLA